MSDRTALVNDRIAIVVLIRAPLVQLIRYAIGSLTGLQNYI
jgi:hypothetical protein